MKHQAGFLTCLLAAASLHAGAQTLGGTQAHIEGTVSLVDLLGGPVITDSFSFDGQPQALPLAGDAFADSVIPSTAAVQAVVETEALSVSSETSNLSGAEPATAAVTATLQGVIGPGQWLLTVTTEHIATLAGTDVTVGADITYSVTSSAGSLVDETLNFVGQSNEYNVVSYPLNVGTGDTATLAASIVSNSASPVFGNAVAQSVAAFDLEESADSDGDGVADTDNNCSQIANPDQRDSNGDGYGNACDADLNNDCIVNVQDLGRLRAVFYTNDADADFDGDGVVNAIDLGVMRVGFFRPPGPSGASGECE